MIAVLALALLTTSCASPPALPGEQAADASAMVTADAGVRLAAAEVEVGTEPAPPPPVDAEPYAVPGEGGSPRPAPAAPPARGHAWIQETMAAYGVYPEAGTQFVIGPMPAGCEGAHGCTQYSYYPDTGVAFDYTITIRPDQLTEYLLFHEIAHARGVRDECGADNFARSVLGPVPGHYC